MPTVKQIKEELQFNAELRGLLEVMRDIAVLQFRTLQEKKKRFVIFAQRLEEFFRMAGLNKASHCFVNPPTERLGIVMFTSDEGFMGGLNLRIIELSLAQPGADKAAFMVVGERGEQHLREIGRECVAFKGLKSEGGYAAAMRLKDYIANGVKSGAFGKILVSYPRCVSFMVQQVEIVPILPIAPEKRLHQAAPGGDEVIIESPIEGIIEYLAEEMVLEKLLEILEESRLSEFAARAIHLEKSSRELDEKEKIIKLRYFHAYHEIVDKSIRELFSSLLIRTRERAGLNETKQVIPVLSR